eukprot:Phypoly_transcript_16813.p1 GENE.Phypoly_transcript_16813~~Phypoly_transcript_16813.p1  ORF type:complete len:153 (+),score=2.74 Phypoly_transcript_16813:368-826(+)
MRCIIQRVLNASVTVDGNVVSKIGPGLLCLVGIGVDDKLEDKEYLCRKILNTRFFLNADTQKNWDKSVTQANYEVLCVSQFTLCHVMKGNKLDFHNAMPPDQAKTFYNDFLDMLRKKYNPELIKDGVFGAYMQVNLTNDGPVTIHLDSRNKD